MRKGQAPETFGQFTLREIETVLDACALRDADLAWLAAEYARFAYHQPNDMPDPPKAPEPKSNGPQSEADVVYVKAWMQSMAKGRMNGR